MYGTLIGSYGQNATMRSDLLVYENIPTINSLQEPVRVSTSTKPHYVIGLICIIDPGLRQQRKTRQHWATGTFWYLVPGTFGGKALSGMWQQVDHWDPHCHLLAPLI